MSAASSEQLQEQARELKTNRRELAKLRDQLVRVQQMLGRVHQICLDHATCDCSAAVMILDVIGEK